MRVGLSTLRHVRGFDVVRPLSIGTVIAIMLPLVLLPLASIFIYGTSKGLGSFWAALSAPEAVFAEGAQSRQRLAVPHPVRRHLGLR